MTKPITPAPPTARQTKVRDEAEALADEMVEHDRTGRRLLDRRNRLWVRASKAGIKVSELADLYGVEQQTVRVVLRQNGAGRRQQ